MSSLKEQWCYQFSAERWSRFFHSRLWLGLPIAALTAFIVIFLIGYIGGMEGEAILVRSGREAIAIAICYLLGMVIATAKTPEEIIAERKREMEEAMEITSKMTRLKAALWILLRVAFLVGLFLLPQFIAAQREGVARVEVITDMVGDAMAGLMLVVVQVIEERKNRE